MFHSSENLPSKVSREQILDLQLMKVRHAKKIIETNALSLAAKLATA